MRLIALDENGHETDISTSMPLLDKQIIRQHSIFDYRCYLIKSKNEKTQLMLSVKDTNDDFCFACISDQGAQIHNRALLTEDEKIFLKGLLPDC